MPTRSWTTLRAVDKTGAHALKLERERSVHIMLMGTALISTLVVMSAVVELFQATGMSKAGACQAITTSLLAEPLLSRSL
jgi:hypothetical protein